MAGEDEEVAYQLEVKDSLTGATTKVQQRSTMFTGTGKATYGNPNKDTFEGVYVFGIRQGRGTYVHGINGDTYSGEWESNMKHGFGRMEYTDKTGDEEADADPKKKGQPGRDGVYLGYFNAGKRGQAELKKDVAGEVNPCEGTYTYSNGDTYVGQWVLGKKHGAGTYCYAKDGTKLVGEWDTGKMTSGKWLFPNGTFYSGPFRYNKPYGKGVWVFKNGTQVLGRYNQKEKQQDGEGGGEEEEGEKPDPPQHCWFTPDKPVLVQGGLMSGPKYAEV